VPVRVARTWGQPQIGSVSRGNTQGYLNLKGYGEFDNANRPDGYNVWLTFVLSPKVPKATRRPSCIKRRSATDLSSRQSLEAAELRAVKSRLAFMSVL
jgi:hypothetical protein